MSMDQLALYEEEPKAETCFSCRHFSELKKPREVAEGAAIYGYCFKDGTKDYSPNMGKGYPVYIPEGKCKDWKKRREDR